MENFRRFARNLKYVMKIFNGTGVKKQGRNWHILVPGGGKDWNFWPKYLPLVFGLAKSSVSDVSQA